MVCAQVKMLSKNTLDAVRAMRPASRFPMTPQKIPPLPLRIRPALMQHASFTFLIVSLCAIVTRSSFGQGTTYEGPVGVTGIFNGNIATGCSYDPLTHSAH